MHVSSPFVLGNPQNIFSIENIERSRHASNDRSGKIFIERSIQPRSFDIRIDCSIFPLIIRSMQIVDNLKIPKIPLRTNP
jgi:hypothetical protein